MLYNKYETGSVAPLPSEVPPSKLSGETRPPPPPGYGSYQRRYYPDASLGASPATANDTLAGDYGISKSGSGGAASSYFGGGDGLPTDELQLPREASLLSGMDLSEIGIDEPQTARKPRRKKKSSSSSSSAATAAAAASFAARIANPPRPKKTIPPEARAGFQRRSTAGAGSDGGGGDDDDDAAAVVRRAYERARQGPPSSLKGGGGGGGGAKTAASVGFRPTNEEVDPYDAFEDDDSENDEELDVDENDAGNGRGNGGGNNVDVRFGADDENDDGGRFGYGGGGVVDDDDESGESGDESDESFSDSSRISIPHSDVVRLIRGGHAVARRQKRRARPKDAAPRKTLYNNPPTHAFVNKSMTEPGKQREAGKKLQLKFYKDCPSMRSSDMKFRKGYGRTAPIWEQIPNELAYNDSKVPISKSLRSARKEVQRPKTAPPRRTARDFGHDLRTIDNIGTRAACPVHLVHLPHEDYRHVKSNMYEVQNKVAPGKGGFKEHKAMGRRGGAAHRRSRRPLDHFFDGVEAATAAAAGPPPPPQSKGKPKGSKAGGGSKKKMKKKKGSGGGGGGGGGGDDGTPSAVMAKVAKQIKKKRQQGHL